MIITILILALLTGLVGLIAVASRRLQGQSLTGQMFRRAFQYLLLYALGLAVANGAADLLGRLVEPQTSPDDTFGLSRSLTYIVIALPIAIVLTWWTQRNHRQYPVERQSLLFQAYLTTASLTGATMTATKVHDAIATGIAAGEFNAAATSGILVWGVMWVGHWRIMHLTLDDSHRVAHRLLGSAIGLVLVASGLLYLLGSSLELFRGSQVIIGRWAELGAAAGLFFSGALLWGLYWLLGASRLPRGIAWHAFVLLLGVTSGLITGLVGAQALLWRGLVNTIGDPGNFSTGTEGSYEAAALLVGATVWWYHRSILDFGKRMPLRRVYEYLVAGIAVAAAATGIGSMLVAFIEAITPAAQIDYTSLNTLLGALTLLAVGTPVWWLHWRSAQRAARQDPATETTALPRRIYLIVLLGTAGVAAVIALILATSDLVHDIVEAQLGLTTLYAVRTEIGYLAASGAVLIYHTAILRQDRRQVSNYVAAQPVQNLHPGTLTLVGPANPSMVKTLTAQSNMNIRFLDADTSQSWQEDTVLARLNTHDHATDLLIIARDEEIEAYLVHGKRDLQ